MMIQTADPATRKKVVILLIAAMLTGLGLFYLLQRYEVYVYIWLSQLGVKVVQTPSLAAVYVGIATIPLYFLIWPMIKLAKSIIHTQRFPPPDTPTFRDVAILEGQTAIRRGKIIFWLCILIIILTLILPFYSWYAVTVIVN